MSGGYAQYARSGFFQLVAVAAINVAVGLVIVRFTEPRIEHVFSRKSHSASPVVNALLWLLVALTYVILASAVWRMRLYVSAYGLTILRCLTFLGMAFCAIVLASLLAKSVSPSFHFYRVVLCGGLALWLVFNLVNVDARIAEYNVDAYLSGSLEALDLDCFIHLSPDADPALERLERSLPSSGYDIADSEIRLHYTTQSDVQELPWQLQCLPYWKALQRGLKNW